MDRVQAALIGAVSALVVVLVKEVLVSVWKDARTTRRSELELYRSYSDPLFAAADSLFWRLRETLTAPGRGAYLKKSGADSYFNKYKFDSTVFRLAVLIAWKRAYQKELAFLSLGNEARLAGLRSALSNFEKALADGTHVETQRLRSLSDLWDVPLPDDVGIRSRLEVEVDQIVKSAKVNPDGGHVLVSELDSAEQLDLITRISFFWSRETNSINVNDDIIQETKARAVRSLSIQEAWLYRDFQSGIGDMMIVPSAHPNRQYDVIGFKEFEVMLWSDDKEQKRWISRLLRVFDRLDISGADRFDARVQMLENALLATADLLIALSEVDEGRAKQAKGTLDEARILKGDQTWRKLQQSDAKTK